MSKKTLLISNLSVVLVLLLGVGLLSLGTPEEAEAVEWSAVPAGAEGHWEANFRSDNLQAYCDQRFGGTVCAEWCEGIDRQPTGFYCCVDPVLLFAHAASRDDCIHEVFLGLEL